MKRTIFLLSSALFTLSQISYTMDNNINNESIFNEDWSPILDQYIGNEINNTFVELFNEQLQKDNKNIHTTINNDNHHNQNIQNDINILKDNFIIFNNNDNNISNDNQKIQKDSRKRKINNKEKKQSKKTKSDCALKLKCNEKECKQEFQATISGKNISNAVNALTRSVLKHKGIKHNTELYKKIDAHVTKNCTKNGKKTTVKCSEENCTKELSTQQSKGALIGMVIAHITNDTIHKNKDIWDEIEKSIHEQNKEIIEKIKKEDKKQGTSIIKIPCTMCSHIVSSEALSSVNFYGFIEKVLMHKYSKKHPEQIKEIQNKIKKSITFDKDLEKYIFKCTEKTHENENCKQILSDKYRKRLIISCVHHLTATTTHNKKEHQETKEQIIIAAKEQNIDIKEIESRLKKK